MKFFGRAWCASIALAGVTTVAVQAAPAPILIKSCTVAKPKPFSHLAGGTQISYVNLGKYTAASVTFVVGYRNAEHNYLRRTTDVGSFAPGATIVHKLTLYNDVTYAGASTTVCRPIQVKWAGGTIWVAPSH
ncbi:MAG: hypothetical protein JO030_04565 [Candidatus Eremiobacteraeota bacterium]|nr:hypothetical protein [Candidatus Eremiobacteraeota bacterium]